MKILLIGIIIVSIFFIPLLAHAKTTTQGKAQDSTGLLNMFTTSEGNKNLISVALLLSITFAPAILLLMSSFTRIVIVLSLLRQAIGIQQLPPNQIIIGLSLFLTFLLWLRPMKRCIQMPYLLI